MADNESLIRKYFTKFVASSPNHMIDTMPPLAAALNAVQSLGEGMQMLGYKAPSWATPRDTITNATTNRVKKNITDAGNYFNRAASAAGFTKNTSSEGGAPSAEEAERIISKFNSMSEAFSAPIDAYFSTPAQRTAAPALSGPSVETPLSVPASTPQFDITRQQGMYLPLVKKAFGMPDTSESSRSTEFVLNPNYYTVGAIGNRKVQQYVPVEKAYSNATQQHGGALAAALASMFGQETDLAKQQMASDALIKAHKISAAATTNAANVSAYPHILGMQLERDAFEQMKKDRSKKTALPSGTGLKPIDQGY